MFRLMLNMHSRLHVPRESWFIIDLLNHFSANTPLSAAERKLAHNIITTHERWQDWEINADTLWDFFKQIEHPYLCDIISAPFICSAKRVNKARWGDKTPGYLTEISRLHSVFPDAKFLHLIRDGRDVCLSLTKVGWHGITIQETAKFWCENVLSAVQFGRRLGGDRYLEIKYEDLVLDTTHQLKAVCEFLNEEYQPQMEHFHYAATNHIAPRHRSIQTKVTRAPMVTDVSRWKNEMTIVQIAVFESIAGKALDILGEPRRLRGIGRLLTILFWLLLWFAKITLPVRGKIGMHFRGLWKKL